MGLGKKITNEIRERMFNRIQLAAEELKEAAQDFAPLKTGQLKNQIETLKPFTDGKRIIQILTSNAFSEGGFNYAKIQHDGPDSGEKLRHVLPEGSVLNQGYQDFGQGDSLDQRYDSGYAQEKGNSDSYNTRYFFRGLQRALPNMRKIMGVT
ncbi:hypothetical protein LCGC14_1924160 [marine sediment metagenome]|uniref:Uncharacterized protein n=1 Tax=marine sediment metagenome TaxID=412755 RepID=A0A0F9GD98_9ZZZZ